MHRTFEIAAMHAYISGMHGGISVTVTRHLPPQDILSLQRNVVMIFVFGYLG